METMQLSVLDLPPDNKLELLPRFGISSNDAEVLENFAQMIGEISLDQLPPQRAGNGKISTQMQPNIPLTIRTTDDQYIDQFRVGDRVTFRDGYRTNLDHEREIGLIVEVCEVVFVVLWGDHKYYCNYTKDHIKRNQWWVKNIEGTFLENSDDCNDFPEIPTRSKTQGYVEHYFVTGKNKKCYWYTRYTYQDISGKLRHHHIPKKQKEAIAAMWHDGASENQICIALGKKYLGKDIS